jgi:SAM-dependent methyltransferase
MYLAGREARIERRIGISQRDILYTLSEHRRFFKIIKPWIRKESTILGFGGAKGSILEEFVRRGIDCHVVDYGERNPLPGILYRKLNLNGILEEYDIAICNHVFEHVADPVSEFLDIRRSLVEDGLLFVEVPFELWRKKDPKPREPVTHINWFSVRSVRRVLEQSRFDVFDLYYSSFRGYNGKKALAVRALARKIENPATAGNPLRGKELELLRKIQGGAISALLENFKVPDRGGSTA